MSAAGKSAEPVHFRGTPRRLAAVLPDLPPQPGGVTVELSLAPAGAPAAGAKRAGQRAAAPSLAPFTALLRGREELRFDLPRQTPPGLYRGVIRIGGEERPVTVEIEPRIRLRLLPKGMRVTARPGERVPFDLSLSNAGNAPAEINPVYGFWLFRDEGVDNILDRVLQPEAQAELRAGRFGPLVDALDEQYGGRVRVRVDRGAGVLQPGEERRIGGVFRMPDKLLAGEIYTGMWPLHNLRWPLRVTAGAGAGRKETTP